jgi:hypothetical protein
MGTGYTIKTADNGYMLEYFSMNSQTFDVRIINTFGPFETRELAEKYEVLHAKVKDGLEGGLR